jgi:replicative DNA helicase
MSETFPQELERTSAPQIVPHSREAEEAVIGAVLINPEAYYDVAEFLTAIDFHIHRLRWVWETFTRLQEQRIPIDLLTVTEDLDKQGHLAEIGGPAYLTALLNNVPTSLHAETYGRMVQQSSIRRRLLEAAQKIAKTAHQEDLSVETAIDEAEKAVFSVSEHRLSTDLQPIKQVLSDYYDRVSEAARRGDEILGVPTGFIDVDRLLGGLQKSDLLIIAGRPGHGKTSFLMSAAKNAALTYKKRIAIFSLEMSNEQLVQRLLSQEVEVDSKTLREGKLTSDQWDRFAEAIDKLASTSIYLDDTPSISPIQLRAKCRRLFMEFGIDLIIVDYLQLMQGDTRNENRVQEVSFISRQLKAIARELNVPVLAAAQLSRAVEQRSDKKPVLSDLRESGSLEQDADIVMFIHRPELYEENSLRKNVAEIMVSKHRNGPTGVVELVFRENLAKFENAATKSVDFTGF